VLEKETDLDALVGRAELLSLVKTAARVDEELAGRLERIAHLEALLAPAEALFQHIRLCHLRAQLDKAALAVRLGPRRGTESLPGRAPSAAGRSSLRAPHPSVHRMERGDMCFVTP